MMPTLTTSMEKMAAAIGVPNMIMMCLSFSSK